MADTLLFQALKKPTKSLTLCNRNLERIPKIIGKLDSVCYLQLKNNKIKTLPNELCNLYQLQVLNLGNNDFVEFSPVLQHLHSLEKLHLFGNKITHIDGSSLRQSLASYCSQVTGSLNEFKSLTFLNLNGNLLQKLPSEICNLINVRHLSLDNNQITELPIEFCTLTTLEELHIAGNRLTALPLEIGYLSGLEKLHLQKNKIRELPEGLGKCYRLRYLDVAANELRIFPTELANIPLQELYCEENPLLQNVPVYSVQEEEVLSLKELCARYVMKELKDRLSYMRRVMRFYPDIQSMLAQSSKCAVCGDSFLNTWLECVQFVEARKDLKLTSMSGTVPVRALLCSYKCFNSAGHRYYGVAFP